MAVNPEFKAHEITEDPIVNEVITMIVKRHMQGMTKFGKTMLYWNEILLFRNLLLLFWVKPLQKLKLCSVFLAILIFSPIL